MGPVQNRRITDEMHWSLAGARAGDQLEIVSVDDNDARVQAMRFGIAEGACVECVTRIPAGPIVIKSGRQEIAIGRGLAGRIWVRRKAEPGVA